MTIRVRAPASTANLGAGFDCAAVALDLWNELEVGEGNGPVDESHLGVRAFAIHASPAGRSFAFRDRIPQERGLGSSAAVIALGLVAGALAAGLEPSPEELLGAGLELEGHADNLAAALAGGVCLTWDRRIARIADDMPAAPIVVVPRSARVSTDESRAALPDAVPRADAVFSTARAALLGAALAQGSAELFAAAADDRLHEPYRTAAAPMLAELRGQLPEGGLAATLSGSGPSVVVWARRGSEAACAAELATRYSDSDVLRLPVTPSGAGPL